MAQCWRIHLPMQEMLVWSLGWEGFLEKEMTAHSSILTLVIPWTEEPGRLQSMGLQESDLTEWPDSNDPPWVSRTLLEVWDTNMHLTPKPGLSPLCPPPHHSPRLLGRTAVCWLWNWQWHSASLYPNNLCPLPDTFLPRSPAGPWFLKAKPSFLSW